MTREERRAILGDQVIAELHKRVDLAPDPSPELVEELRRIWTAPREAATSERPASTSKAA
jgi:hypothetical protein